MEKIKIKIPDNLTPIEETFAIAKQLTKKALSSGGRKMIGTGVEVKHIQTEITVTRESSEPIVKTLECSVCKTNFEKNLGFHLFNNYGGKYSKTYYCSEKCRNVVIDICGEDRVWTTKKKSKPVINFKRK